MIIKAEEKNRSTIMNYLNRDRVINLFLVGDIENFGFDRDFLHIYIAEAEGSIQAVYLFWHDSLVICSYDLVLDLDFIRKKVQEHAIKVISAVEPLIDKIEQLPHKARTDTYFAKMTERNLMIDTAPARYATYDELPQIAAIQTAVFDNDRNSLEALQNSFKTQSGRSVAVFENDTAVSIASSTAECQGLGMVVGVGTLPAYRHRHYASKCVTKLSNDLLNEGKTPCLFYNNPSAGRIYKALGYKDIGRWSMLKL